MVAQKRGTHERQSRFLHVCGWGGLAFLCLCDGFPNAHAERVSRQSGSIASKTNDSNHGNGSTLLSQSQRQTEQKTPYEVKRIGGTFFAVRKSGIGTELTLSLHQVWDGKSWQPVTAAHVPKNEVIASSDKFHYFQFKMEDGKIIGETIAIYQPAEKQWRTSHQLRLEESLDPAAKKVLREGQKLLVEGHQLQDNISKTYQELKKRRDRWVPYGRNSSLYQKVLNGYQSRLGHLARGGVEATRIQLPDEILRASGYPKEPLVRDRFLKFDSAKGCPSESDSLPRLVVVAQDPRKMEELQDYLQKFKAALAIRKVSQMSEELKNAAVASVAKGSEVYFRGLTGLINQGPRLLTGRGVTFSLPGSGGSPDSEPKSYFENSTHVKELSQMGIDLVLDLTPQMAKSGKGYLEYVNAMEQMFPNLVAAGLGQKLAESPKTQRAESIESRGGPRCRLVRRIYHDRFEAGLDEGEPILQQELCSRSRQATELVTQSVRSQLLSAEGQFLSQLARQGLAQRGCLGLVWDEETAKQNRKSLKLTGEEGASAFLRIPTGDPERPEAYVKLSDKTPEFVALLLDTLLAMKRRDGKLTSAAIRNTIRHMREASDGSSASVGMGKTSVSQKGNGFGLANGIPPVQ